MCFLKYFTKYDGRLQPIQSSISFMGGSVKFVLEYAEPFWRTRAMPAHEYLSLNGQPMMITTNPSGMRQKLLYIVLLPVS